MLSCIAVVGGIGSVLLAASRAATPIESFEPENGVLASGAALVTDTSASAGKSVKFPTSGPLQPLGIPGTWNIRFQDEFNGTTLDTSKWTTLDGWSMNNVTTHTANVSVSGGSAILTLASSTSGAEICSCNSANYTLPVGGYAEARVYFPGTSTQLYNWPAWWVSGPNWPAAGEHDIAEVLSGEMTVNYHSAGPASRNHGVVPGVWQNAYHVYGVHRKASSADVYYDGKLVKSYPTDDNGAGQHLIVNVGRGGGPTVYGSASQIKVDYVRTWH